MELFLVIIVSICFGLLFFSEEFSHKLKFAFNSSLIAGISLAYFFLLLLPEIAEGLPEFPLGLKLFEFFFIFIGFITIHVIEKVILQKVESRSQKKVRDLIKVEEELEAVEKNIEDIINVELKQEELDIFALRDLGSTLSELNERSSKIKNEIDQIKLKIQMHIEANLSEIRFFTNFIYHFIIGILIFTLLFIDFFSGILFFIFAFFRLVIIRDEQITKEVYSDLDIKIKYKESKSLKLIQSSSVLIGVMIGIYSELFSLINLEIIYILYSFISGIILYTIVREVIPEKEMGDPLYFLIGAIGFTVIILFIKIYTRLLPV